MFPRRFALFFSFLCSFALVFLLFFFRPYSTFVNSPATACGGWCMFLLFANAYECLRFSSFFASLSVLAAWAPMRHFTHTRMPYIRTYARSRMSAIEITVWKCEKLSTSIYCTGFFFFCSCGALECVLRIMCVCLCVASCWGAALHEWWCTPRILSRLLPCSVYALFALTLVEYKVTIWLL